MAQIANLPPQAYTRETLIKAIEWLSLQPSGLREKARSADLVVSYYLQARRKAEAQMEAPVSGEAFKADLKHLAEDLKQFEDPTHAVSPLIRSYASDPLADDLPPHPTPPPRIVHGHGPTSIPTDPPRTEPPVRGVSWSVDSRSMTLAVELKQRLNLSNEGDALRMLIQLGAERVRELFP